MTHIWCGKKNLHKIKELEWVVCLWSHYFCGNDDPVHFIFAGCMMRSASFLYLYQFFSHNFLHPYTHIYMYMYTYTYSYTHINTHTQSHLPLPLFPSSPNLKLYSPHSTLTLTPLHNFALMRFQGKTYQSSKDEEEKNHIESQTMKKWKFLATHCGITLILSGKCLFTFK